MTTITPKLVIEVQLSLLILYFLPIFSIFSYFILAQLVWTTHNFAVHVQWQQRAILFFSILNTKFFFFGLIKLIMHEVMAEMMGGMFKSTSILTHTTNQLGQRKVSQPNQGSSKLKVYTNVRIFANIIFWEFLIKELFFLKLELGHWFTSCRLML